VGVPSASSTAFSSIALEVDETEETEPRRAAELKLKPGENWGGELLDVDTRRWEAADVAADAIVEVGWGTREEEKYSEREREPRRSVRGCG